MICIASAPLRRLARLHEVPEDAVITIQPRAMRRLQELKEQQKSDGLILRMGVRNGGCSGLSYVMDFTEADSITDDDQVDVYESENITCVVDAKSMLYLFGLELDYSTELIGGGTCVVPLDVARGLDLRATRLIVDMLLHIHPHRIQIL